MSETNGNGKHHGPIYQAGSEAVEVERHGNMILPINGGRFPNLKVESYQSSRIRAAGPGDLVLILGTESDADDAVEHCPASTVTPHTTHRTSPDDYQGKRIIILHRTDPGDIERARDDARYVIDVAASVTLVGLPGWQREMSLRDWLRVAPWQAEAPNGFVGLVESLAAADPTPLGPDPDRADDPTDDAPITAPKPSIRIDDANLHEMTDQTIAALAAEESLYQRGGCLVVVNRDVQTRKRRGLRQPAGTPRITQLPIARLREMATRHADWTKEKMTRSGLPLILSTGPHEKTIQAVEARGEWPCIRPIEGIIESPTIRPDGTILSIPGWDEITGLLYEPGTDFGVIPDQPSRLDAQEAAGKILLVVRDFPFADDAHLATWLAGLLTVVGRHAIEGPTPLFLIDANAPGTGKSLLCDIPAMIATGRPMSRADYPEDDAEMAKTILSIALAAERVVMFDNISSGGTIGGPSLDRALTARTVKGRILGRSEMSAELPMNACFWATGNNIGLKGDAMRRVVPCRLESMVERPEERCDFSIKGDILQYVGNHRTELVVAALTILRAHAVAGRPDAGLTPFGSYEAWSNVIRNAVHWVTGHDPCKSREAARLDDPESIEREAIVLGLAELPNIRSGLTAAEILRILDNKDHQDKFETLRDVILGWSKDSKLPGSKVVGRHLRVQKGRVVSGKVLTSKPYDGSQRWSVKDV